MNAHRPGLCLVAVISLSLIGTTLVGCDQEQPAVEASLQQTQTETQSQDATSSETESPAATPTRLADVPLSESRERLIDLAFDAASSIAIEPHVKDRSRTQQLVIEACLAMDQPKRAERSVENIVGWRKGMSHAMIARYAAKHGCVQDLGYHIAVADRMADQESEWRRDRIRVTIGQTWAWLEKDGESRHYESRVEQSEQGKVDIVRAELADAAFFDAHLDRVEALTEAGQFDPLRNALVAASRLYERFYADTDRRQRAETLITSAWAKIPYQVRFEMLERMVDAAMAHQDAETALRLTVIAAGLLDESRWTAEYLVPLLGRLAVMQHHAGDRDAAITSVTRAMESYDEGRRSIANVFRGEALRPLASAHHLIGDRAGALRLYRLVLDEGFENPNQRPRAMDFAATCADMARIGFEPDDALWSRITEISEALKQQ